MSIFIAGIAGSRHSIADSRDSGRVPDPSIRTAQEAFQAGSDRFSRAFDTPAGSAVTFCLEKCFAGRPQLAQWKRPNILIKVSDPQNMQGNFARNWPSTRVQKPIGWRGHGQRREAGSPYAGPCTLASPAGAPLHGSEQWVRQLLKILEQSYLRDRFSYKHSDNQQFQSWMIAISHSRACVVSRNGEPHDLSSLLS